MPLLLGAVGPDTSSFRCLGQIDPASGVAKVATIMRVGSTDLRLSEGTSWVWITK